MQREGPPVATGVGDRGLVLDDGADAAEGIDHVGGDVDGARPAVAVPRSSIGGVGLVMRGPRRKCERASASERVASTACVAGERSENVMPVSARERNGVGLLRRHEGVVALDLMGDLGVVPSELAADERGRGPGGGERGRPVEQVRPGAADEHVDQRGGHLVADGVHRLGAQVRHPVDQRLAERRIIGDQAVELGGARPVPAAEMGGQSAPRGLAVAVPAEQGELLRAAPGVVTEALGDDVDGVFRHLSVGGELAAGDRDDAGRPDRHAVAPGEIGRPVAGADLTSGRSPAHTR